MREPKYNNVSIAFQDMWEQESIALFSSTMGKEIVDLAIDFLASYEGEYSIADYIAGEIMAKFVIWLNENKKLQSKNAELYFGVDETDGNNSDYGHYVVNVIGTVVRHVEEC